jgi:hypothetical protein
MGEKTSLGGQAMMSTWVLKEELSIQKNGKRTGRAMQRRRTRKRNLRMNVAFISAS